MDVLEIKAINAVAEQNSTNALAYKVAREKHAKAKYFIDIQLIKGYQDKTIAPSIAYEKAIILVASFSEQNKRAYNDYLREEATYKGMEKVIEANSGQISWAQSKLKYEDRG